MGRGAARERLWRVPVTGPGALGTPEPLLSGAFGRSRAVAPTPDGGALGSPRATATAVAALPPDDDRILVVPLR